MGIVALPGTLRNVGVLIPPSWPVKDQTLASASRRAMLSAGEGGRFRTSG
jgi:hypothetical protein